MRGAHRRGVRPPQLRGAVRPAPAEATWRLTARGVTVVMAVGGLLLGLAAVVAVSAFLTITAETATAALG